MTNPAALAMEQRRFRGIASSVWHTNSHRPGASFKLSFHCCGPLQTLVRDTVRAFSRAGLLGPQIFISHPGLRKEYQQKTRKSLKFYGGSWPDTGELKFASHPHTLSWQLLWACCTMHHYQLAVCCLGRVALHLLLCITEILHLTCCEVSS